MILATVAVHAALASRSFGIAHKGIHLPCGVERPVFSYACPQTENPCTMHHFWSGGTFSGCKPMQNEPPRHPALTERVRC